MPAVLVAAMQAHGLRPISLECPGFGLTTEAAGDVSSEAVEDLADVFDALGLAQACLLGRSCVMPLQFAAAYPERMIRGVLLSTSPPGMRPNRGLFGRITPRSTAIPSSGRSRGSWTVGNGGAVGGVPEPASWTLLITGFAFMGTAMRQRTGQRSVAA